MSEAEKISSKKWQKMVKNWSKWSKLPDFDGLRTGGFFHPQKKLNLFWYHQYYSEYESGSQSKSQNLLPPLGRAKLGRIQVDIFCVKKINVFLLSYTNVTNP